MSAPVSIDLAGLADRHDVFFVDQFGVLHDGERPYAGAVEALQELKRGGATIVLLSNSGRRSLPNEQRLRKLGFALGSWDVFLSSGEVAWQMLAEGRLGARAGRCLLLSRGGDRSAVEGLPLQLTDSGSDADLVLIGGSEGDRLTMDHYRRLLEPAARRRVPALCTNPDRVMLTASGPRFGAGCIAECYEELGGAVVRVGKPFAEIYRAALEAIGNPQPDRIVCVGDSIEHDIAGAGAAGVRSALLRTGILADVPLERLPDLYARERVVPDFLLERFAFC